MACESKVSDLISCFPPNNARRGYFWQDIFFKLWFHFIWTPFHIVLYKVYIEHNRTAVIYAILPCLLFAQGIRCVPIDQTKSVNDYCWSTTGLPKLKQVQQIINFTQYQHLSTGMKSEWTFSWFLINNRSGKFHVKSGFKSRKAWDIDLIVVVVLYKMIRRILWKWILLQPLLFATW